MPARNASNTVLRAVTSTLADLPSKSELLVLDDCSTDNTLEKLSMVNDSRLRVLTGTSPLGVAGGLNRLLEEAESPVIARMDADDLTLRGRFARQLRQLTNYDLVFSARLNFGSSPSAFRPSLPLPIRSALMPFVLASTNPVPHSSLMARREVLTGSGGYRSGSAEDYDLWLRLAAANVRIFSSAIPGIGYRMHETQVTKSTHWRARYIDDVALNGAHANLCRHVGWDRTEGLWNSLAKLKGDRTPEEVVAVAAFNRFLHTRAARLGAAQGVVFDLATR